MIYHLTAALMLVAAPIGIVGAQPDRSPDIAAAAVRVSAYATYAAPTRVRAAGRRQRQDLQHAADQGTRARAVAGPRCGLPAPSDCRPRPAQSAQGLLAQLHELTCCVAVPASAIVGLALAASGSAGDQPPNEANGSVGPTHLAGHQADRLRRRPAALPALRSRARMLHHTRCRCTNRRFAPPAVGIGSGARGAVCSARERQSRRGGYPCCILPGRVQTQPVMWLANPHVAG